MRKTIIMCILFCLMLVSAASAAEERLYDRIMRTGILRCGYIVWQPYMMKDPNTGKLSGMSYDVYEALAQNIGLKIEWVSEVQVGQQAEALNTGKVDAICGDWPLNANAVKYVDYLRAYAYFPVYLYQKKGGKKFSSLDQVNNANISISAMDGDVSLLVVEKKFPKAKKIQVPASADPTQISLNVVTGKADLVSNDPFTISYFNAASNNTLVPVLDQKPLVTLKTSGSVKRGEADLKSMLNEGIELLITSGELDEILNKYDPDHTKLKRPEQMWKD